MPIQKEKRKYLQVLVNLLLLVAVFALLIHVEFFKNKIAYIDTNKIFNNYKGLIIAKKEYEKKVNLYKERVDTLSGRIKLDMLSIEKFRSDKSKYKNYVDSVQYHKKQLNDYQRGMAQALKEEEGRLTQATLTKLNDFLKTYGKKEHYDIIFIANSTGTIAYAKDSYDITDKVLEEINKEYE